MTGRFKASIPLILGVLLSIGLLIWLFSHTDFQDMWSKIKKVDLYYLITAGFAFIVTNILIFWRWRILMRALGLKARRFSSIRWFSVALFLNLLPVSSIGGDVVKGMGLSSETGHRPKVFASIVLDRLCGFSGIVILATIAYLFGHNVVNNKLILLAISCMAFFSFLLIVILFNHRIYSFTCGVFHKWPKVKDGLMSLHYNIVLLKGKQKQAWLAIGISILSQVILAVEFYLTAKGLHQDVDITYFIIFSPLVCVATCLPSIGGLGWREFGWVTLLGSVGMDKEVASALSIINSAFIMVFALLAGVFYVVTLSSRRVQHYPSEPELKPRHA